MTTSKKPIGDGYLGTLLESPERAAKRIMIGVPMTGLLRSEWVMARYGQVTPCNWSAVDYAQWIDQYSPIRYSVADARNLIGTRAIKDEYEWLFFIDHDVVLPPVTLLRLNEYMLEGKVPVVGGLYFTRSVPSEPLIYRGRGNSYYTQWSLGDKVWVDGMGLGCHLINVSVLRALSESCETYQLYGQEVFRLFITPAKSVFDPETSSWSSQVGTEDLEWYSRVMETGALAKAGWKSVARRKYPFLCDTSLYCKHIDWSGVQYPARGEDTTFLPKDIKSRVKVA